MKHNLITFTAVFLLSGGVSVFAAVNNDSISYRTHANEQQIQGLASVHKGTAGRVHVAKHKKTTATVPPVATRKHIFSRETRDADSISYRTNANEQQIQDLQQQVARLEAEQKKLRLGIKEPLVPKETLISRVFAHGPAVVTSPYFGGEGNYSGFDLLTNLPDINEDASFLKVRQQVENYYKSNNIPDPDRPVIALTGEVEGQAFHHSRINFRDSASDNDINLSTAKLEVFAEVSKWISAMIGFNYDDYPPSLGGRYSNSKVYVSRAYATIGNLNELPAYFSIGQIYVPFGVYSSNAISDSSTKLLGKTKARAAVLGFTYSGVYGSAYMFQGDTYTPDYRRNWGANLGYAYNNHADSISFDVGGGYIYNIADSKGMQGTGDGVFGGFGYDPGMKKVGGSENLHDNIPAADVHGSFTYRNFNIFAEYVSAVRKFDARDLAYGNSVTGAEPSAFDITASYNFKICNKPSYASIGFGGSSDALAINLPKNDYFVVVGTSIWKSTVQTVEFRHDIDYDSGVYSSGNGRPVLGTGNSRNMIIGAFRVYF